MAQSEQWSFCHYAGGGFGFHRTAYEAQAVLGGVT